MVVSNATRARSRRDKVPITNISAAAEAQHTSESSRADPRSIGQRLEYEAYVMLDALKNFMTIMTDTILQQVTEQVRTTMEVVNSMRLLPTFDYEPTVGCKPSYRRAPMGSLCQSDEGREITLPGRNERSYERNHDCSRGVDAQRAHLAAPGRLANSATASTLYVTQSQCVT